MPDPTPTPAQPLVTIVTPSYNQGEFIADAIDSVLSQDYPAIEYLVVDGGSTDGTLDVLRRYGDRVRWMSGPDDGQTDAIARGFEAGAGKYLAWLNSDDRYVPGAISRAVADLEAHPDAALAYGYGEFIDREGHFMMRCAHVEPWDRDRLVKRLNLILQPATLFRRDAYVAIGGLDRSLHYVMDYDLWLRLSARYPVRFIPDVIAQARVYGETKTETGGLPRMEEMARMIRSNCGRGLPTTYRREMRIALRYALADAAGKRQPARVVRLAARITPYMIWAAIWKVRHRRRHRAGCPPA